jgi:hypothetical protein
MKFINNPMDAFAEKKALLEEAPSPKVFNLSIKTFKTYKYSKAYVQ